MWQRDDGWAGSEIEDSFVMVNIDTGKYVALNATAAAVWEALAEPCSADAIAERLQGRFAVAPDECQSAVTALLAKMHGLSMAAPL